MIIWSFEGVRVSLTPEDPSGEGVPGRDATDANAHLPVFAAPEKTYPKCV